jgi:signal peptidase I
MNIYFDFPLLLTSLVLISGVVALLDILFWEKARNLTGKKQPKLIEYCRSFFPVLLLVLLIRSFLVQPYKVPSGSLEPTIAPGDFIVVNQFAYGLRLPVLNTKIYNIGEPQRGDIALFRWPKHPDILFIKRVVGVPGDHIVYKNKTLTVNGAVMHQQFIGKSLDEEGEAMLPVEVRSEALGDVRHSIFVRTDVPDDRVSDVVVPEGHYFMMGDNRDGSDDSRDWGFVPEENLVGKALAIWMSWDHNEHNIRWNRIGKKIE